MIDGVLDLVKNNRLKAEDIEKVKVGTFKVGIDTLMKPEERRYRPKTIVDAQFSIPFTVAAAIVGRRISLSKFTEASIRDPEILEVAAKVSGEEEPEFTKGYPARFPTSIEIRTKAGTALNRFVEIPSGDPAKKEYAANHSKFDEEMEGKFRELISGIPLFSERSEDIVREVKRVEDAESIVPLMDYLRP